MLLQRLVFVIANQVALLTWKSNIQTAQAKSRDTYLLETRRRNHGISQLFLQTVTDHNLALKAKANQSFRFTLPNTGG